MEILTALISILAITGAVWLFNKISPFKVCPICAGVSGTWIWMLAFMVLGYGYGLVSPLVVALLMGGSVVGIAYKADKFVPDKLDLVWKTSFITAGFAAQYMLLTWQMGYFIPLLALLLLIAWFFTILGRKRKEESPRVKELEKGLEKCC